METEDQRKESELRSGLSLQEYASWTKTTAIYPQDDSNTLPEMMYLGLGLSSEAGEVSGLIKKWWRDGVFSKDSLKKELGDVFYYLAAICRVTGLDLQEVLEENVRKLEKRKTDGVLGGSGDSR